MENHIPTPNPFLTHFFFSAEWIGAGGQASHLLADMFTVVVAKDSGDLSRSPIVTPPFIGGEKHDRLEFLVVSGIGTHGDFGKRPGYGAAHEFGSGIHPESTGRGIIPQQPVDDWVKVLAIVNSLP